MKPDRLVDALNRVSRGLSTIIDARMLRDELIDVIEKLSEHYHDRPGDDYAEKLAALRKLKL